MTHQHALLYLQNQYRQLSENCEQWASFTHDPAFASLLREQVVMFGQFSNELASATDATLRQHLKATTSWLKTLYLQREDILVAGACYRALKPVMGTYQKLLHDPALPKHLQQLANRHYAVLDQGATVLHRMMTV